MGVEKAPEEPAEPSEGELRAILEERDQVQTAARQRLAGRTTRVVLVLLALGVIAFASFRENREMVAGLFREPEPEPVASPQAVQASGEPESVEDQLMRAVSQPAVSSLVSPDGKIVTKADIGLAMEVLNFMQGPPEHAKAQPAPTEAKKEPNAKAP